MSNEYWLTKKMTDEQWLFSNDWRMNDENKNKHDEGNSKGSNKRSEETENEHACMKEGRKEGRKEWMNDVGWWWKFQLQEWVHFFFRPWLAPRCPVAPLPGTVKSTDLASRCTVMVKWLETNRSGVPLVPRDNLGISKLWVSWRSW